MAFKLNLSDSAKFLSIKIPMGQAPLTTNPYLPFGVAPPPVPRHW